jgi:hydrophobic/amphiphilic exporter-1 (mainly G- bacteria), HAE1 family
MQWLANVCVRRPIFAIVLIAVFVVVGWVGYKRLGVDKFPKVDFPLITIVTPYPGASPGAVESDVSQKIEEAVNTVSGLDTITSVSTEGVSLVIAQFDLEVNPDKASQDIQEHINTVLRDLPPGVRPEVRKADPDAAPIIVLSVKGPQGMSTRELTRFADKSVKQRIERLKGVGQARSSSSAGRNGRSTSTSIRSASQRRVSLRSKSNARSRLPTSTCRAVSYKPVRRT